MSIFILGILYILQANHVIIPHIIWVISWGYFTLEFGALAVLLLVAAGMTLWQWVMKK